MLHSDLNKFKYINNTINFNEEQLADLLLLLDDNRTRSQFILAIEKNKKNSKPVKPSVEVREYMTTTARYVEKKIVITGFYSDHVQHYLLGNIIKRIRSNLVNDSIVRCEEYHPLLTAGADSEGVETSKWV